MRKPRPIARTAQFLTFILQPEVPMSLRDIV